MMKNYEKSIDSLNLQLSKRKCTGFLPGDQKEFPFDDAGTRVVIVGIGFLETIGSVPFFIVSGRNKEKTWLCQFL
jgi:hypothetical protein